MFDLRRILTCAVLAFCVLKLPGQTPAPRAQQWADSVLGRLSLEQKVGQLFMVAVFGKEKTQPDAYVLRLVKEGKLGGLIFMQGEPYTQAQHVNSYQAAAGVPLLIGQDAEWGLNMRMKAVSGYPRNMSLGAIRNDSLIFEMGEAMARQLRSVGVNINFAPVLDMNSNPANPVINYRSFGDNKFNVAKKGIMFSRGLQNGGVMACLKHFPGHGDTDTDSHLSLPELPHSLERLDTVELYPFAQALQRGAQAVMIGHLKIPALDPLYPASLSPRIVTELLRNQIGFDGLILSDALNMQGITRNYSAQEIAKLAFLAGNDILLYPDNLGVSAEAITAAVRSGEIAESALNERVLRILRHKYLLGLQKWKALDPAKALAEMDNAAVRVLQKKLYEASVTVVKNEGKLLPFNNLERLSIASVQIGGNELGEFDKTLKKYAGVKSFALSHKATEAEIRLLRESVDPYGIVVVSLFELNYKIAERFGFSQTAADVLSVLRQSGKKVVLVLFGSPYSLGYAGAENAIVMAYEATPVVQQAAASVLFGGLRADARLPVTAAAQFPAGRGLSLNAKTRFGFALPEEEGLDSEALAVMDTLIMRYIRQQLMPGCAVLVARGNRIVYDKGFGQNIPGPGGTPIDPYYHTYDLASVTKVAAATLSLMKLDEMGWISLDAPLTRYLPEFAGTDKAGITIRQLLEHRAGFPAFHPFYQKTWQEGRPGKPDPRYYSHKISDSHSVMLSQTLYSRPELQDSVWQWLKQIPVKPGRGVLYSDLSMMVAGKIVERVSGMRMETFAASKFYQPMGMNSTWFRPAWLGLAERCPPTAIDGNWRHGLVQGTVHDEAAAILGGESGNAGLFSNVYDLAKLSFMLKNKGVYGDDYYLQPKLIQQYTRQQSGASPRGLGWNKPEPQSQSSTVSVHASADTYGHTGFTGTCMWIDPQYDLIFIFLTNRTYTPNSRAFVREGVRKRVMDQAYEAIFSYEKKYPGRKNS